MAARLVFGYVRVSTDAQEVARQERSIPEQHSRLPNGLADADLVLFYDKKSGWSGATRPGYEEMLSRIHAGEAAALIVDTSSRLTRQGIRKALEIFGQLEDVSCRLWTTKGQEYTFDAHGYVMLILDAEADQRFSDNLSHNIRTGKATRSAQGLAHFGGLPPGYDRLDTGEAIPNDDLKLMIEAFRRAAVNKTYASICEFLTSELSDLALSHLKNRTVRPYNLRRWLNNPIYLGLIQHKGELFTGQHDAAVSLDTWEAVQARFSDNRTKYLRPPRTWPWTSILRCSNGHAMRVHPIKYRVYVRCSEPTCEFNRTARHASVIEANVLSAFFGTVLDVRDNLTYDDSYGEQATGPSVQEAKEALDAAQEHAEEVAGCVSDGLMKRNDPRYAEAKEALDAAKTLYGLVSRDSDTYRAGLQALVDRVLNLGDLITSGDRRYLADDACVRIDGYPCHPDHQLQASLLGWDYAGLEQRCAIIQESLHEALWSDDTITLTFRLPLPARIAATPPIETSDKAAREVLEGAGYGLQYVDVDWRTGGVTFTPPL